MDGSLDANVLLRWVLGDVPEHYQAVDALLAAGTFEVDDLALSEFAYVAEKVYRIPRIQVSAMLRGILGNGRIQAQRDVLLAVLELFDVHGMLSFGDCYLLVRAETTGSLPLWTFDKALIKKSGGRAKVVPID